MNGRQQNTITIKFHETKNPKPVLIFITQMDLKNHGRLFFWRGGDPLYDSREIIERLRYNINLFFRSFNSSGPFETRVLFVLRHQVSAFDNMFRRDLSLRK